jgi:hypothetical protein
MLKRRDWVFKNAHGRTDSSSSDDGVLPLQADITRMQCNSNGSALHHGLLATLAVLADRPSCGGRAAIDTSAPADASHSDSGVSSGSSDHLETSSTPPPAAPAEAAATTTSSDGGADGAVVATLEELQATMEASDSDEADAGATGAAEPRRRKQRRVYSAPKVLQAQKAAWLFAAPGAAAKGAPLRCLLCSGVLLLNSCAH